MFSFKKIWKISHRAMLLQIVSLYGSYTITITCVGFSKNSHTKALVNIILPYGPYKNTICSILFPTCRRILKPLQQTTFENFVTKEEISQNEQFLLLTECLQLYSISMSSFREIFHIIVEVISKSSAADLLYVGKG